MVVLTTYENDADILRAVEAGATGYLLKDAGRSDLAGAIREAARGKTVLAPAIAARLVSRMRSPVDLTPREIEVLRLVGAGRTNAEIGRELLVSEATVKTHLLRTFGKLGVSDRTAAVTVALQRGISHRAVRGKRVAARRSSVEVQMEKCGWLRHEHCRKAQMGPRPASSPG
ncbi:hypothetical protein Sm713_75140 [Streptomyces sp. TS71-3]|nr:hypothetical protein Sm713_75140 [Streptomyces sp. TS71-3]